MGEAGHRLSGGERQRLAIARAFLRDANLVIVDEPTAHLDEPSTSLVLEAVNRLAHRRTVLIVAHAPEAAAAADVVLRMEAGRIVEYEPVEILPEPSEVAGRGGRP